MLTHVSIPHDYTIEYNHTGYVHACVNVPYLFAIGQFRSNGSILSCTECRLYTCLNHSVPINVTKDSVFSVRQRTDLWVPVQISEPWSGSTLLSFVLRESLKRSKRFLGWIIAAIVGIISVVTVGTVSGMALYNSIQNHDLPGKKDSHDLWARQAQIDQQIQTRLDDLQAALMYAGDDLHA